MTIGTWGEAIGSAFSSFWSKIIGYLPNLVGAIQDYLGGKEAARKLLDKFIEDFKLKK